MLYYKHTASALAKLRVSAQYRKEHKYFPEPAAFDIETSRFQDMAFMYIWQFAIGESYCVFGRTWEEFKDFLAMLQDELQLAADFRLCIFDHDLRYEFGFFRRIIYIDEDSLIARTQRQIIYFTSGCFEFRDSYSYTEMPLKDLGKEVGIPKLEDYDYDSIRLPITPLSDRELQYCENDVKILTRYFSIELNQYKVISRLPLTLTKRVEKVMASNMNDVCTRQQRFQLAARQLDAASEEDYLLLNYLRVAYFGGFNYATTLHRNDILSDVFGADIDTSYVAQILFHRFPVTKFKKLDSFKPFTWEPKKNPGNMQIHNIMFGREDFANRALLIHFRAHDLKAKIPELAFLPIYPKNYLGRAPEARRRMKTEHVAECSYVDTVLTDVDFRLMIQHYTFSRLDVDEIFWSRYMPLPEYVIQSAVQLAATKKAAKEELSAIQDRFEHATPDIRPQIQNILQQTASEYLRIKSMCARIYGVFVKDPIRMQYKFSNAEGKVNAVGLTGIEDAALDINGERKRNFAPTMYQWGVWVASWARKELLDICYQIGEYCPIRQPEGYFNGCVLYCDTDSCYFFDCPEAIGIIKDYNRKKEYQLKKICQKYGFTEKALKGIGTFRIDRFSKFKVIGLKQYAFITAGGQFKYHISGLPQPEYNSRGELIKGKWFEQYETAADKLAAVTEDMQIPAELTGTLKSRYRDSENCCCVSDSFGNCMHIEIPSCIILEPQAFKMSMSPLEEIKELIEDMDPDKLAAVVKRNFRKELK